MPAVAAAGRWLTRRAGARGVCALRLQRRRKLTGALWKSKLRSATSCKLQAELCWAAGRVASVVFRKPQQRVSYFICFRCIRILLATRLGNAIEQEFHIVFTASRRSLEEESYGWAWEHTFGLDCSMLATGQSSTLQNFTVKLKKLQETKERCKL